MATESESKLSRPTPRASARMGRPSRRWVLFQASLLLVCIGLFGLATVQVHNYDAGVVREVFTLRGPIPLPIARYIPAHAPLGVVAIVVHGYSANKELMSSFGVDLAKAGVTTYTYDLPGHGASTVPYRSVEQLVASVGEVVDYARTHASAAPTPPKLVLIGYSIGTIAVGEYALRYPNLPSLAATVLVAGILQDRPTLSNPPNLLVLSGQFDLPGINDISRALIAAGCGVAAPSVTNTYRCNSQAPNAHRERLVLPGLDHISIVTASSTHADVINWLGAYVDPRIGSVHVNTDTRLHWMLLGFAMAALGTLPLLALGSAVLGLLPTQPVSRRRSARGVPASALPSGSGVPLWLGAGLLAGALAIGLAILHAVLPPSFWAPSPLAFLAQQVSADVATFFLVTGLALTGMLASIPPLRVRLVQALRTSAPAQVALAAAVVIFLYCTLGSLSSFAWESFTLTPARLWRAAVYAVMLWPFLYGTHTLRAAHRWRQHGGAALADLASTFLVVAALIVAIVTNFARLSYLGILLPVFAIVLLGFVGFNAWARRVVAAPTVLLASAETLVLAWALAATLPLAA
jgi:pimeloyl-ACP methyl ester carboxylesterase